MNENINDITYEFIINGESHNYNLDNLVLYTENVGEAPSRWFFYTTTGERLSIPVADGNAFVGDIVASKGFDWYERNKNKQFIYEIVGEENLRDLEEKFNNEFNNQQNEDEDELDDEDEYDDEFEDEYDDEYDDDNIGYDRDKLKKYGKIAVIVAAGIVVVTIGGKIIKNTIDNHKNNPTTSTSQSTTDKKNLGSFDEMLTSANNNTQKGFMNSLNNYLTIFNDEKGRNELGLDEALAIKIVENSHVWSRTEIGDIFNGASLDEDDILSNYRSGFLKVVQALATANNSAEQFGILNFSTSCGKAYKYFLDQEDDSVKKLLPAFYEKIVEAVNKGTATWEDYAVCNAAFVRFGDLDTDTMEQINAKGIADAKEAISRVSTISNSCYKSDGYSIDDFVEAWYDSYDISGSYGDLEDNSRFNAIRKSLNKYTTVNGAIKLELEETTKEDEKVTLPELEDDKNSNQTTTKSSNSNNTTTTRNSNGNSTTTRSNNYNYPSTTSDYSTGVYDEDTTSDYSTTENNNNNVESTTEYFVQESTTNAPEIPSTTEPHYETTTEHYATYVDEDNWWETQGEVVGMSTKTEDKPAVLVKKI